MANGRDKGGRFVGLKLVGDWKEAKQVLADAPSDLEQATEAAVAAVAEFLAGQIKKKIASNIAPPNSGFTILMKRSSKTLINKGDLRAAPRALKVGKFTYFVGIPSALSGGKGGKGGKLASLAAVLEEGHVVVMKMTDKQRRFLHAKLGQHVKKIPGKGGSASSGILVIHIPARPFIQPAYDEFQPKAKETFEKYLGRNLKKLKGA